MIMILKNAKVVPRKITLDGKFSMMTLFIIPIRNVVAPWRKIKSSTRNKSRFKMQMANFNLQKKR